MAATHRPCTKGIWLWSSPLRRTALDGTEYNLLLLDTEGIDAYDQTVSFHPFNIIGFLKEDTNLEHAICLYITLSYLCIAKLFTN